MAHDVIPFPNSHVAGDRARLRAKRAVYTVREVAALLSLSDTSTYALVRTGAIPARKLGGRWVIPKQRFHAWLNSVDVDDLASVDTFGKAA